MMKVAARGSERQDKCTKCRRGEWPQGGIRRLNYGEGGEAVECYWLLALAHQFAHLHGGSRMLRRQRWAG